MSLPHPREAMQDEIILEVRAIRDRLAARFDYDLDRLFEEAKRSERASDRERTTPAPRRLLDTRSKAPSSRSRRR